MCHRTDEEAAGIRRPLLAGVFGCGGVQPSEFGVRLGRGLTLMFHLVGPSLL
jgi:hypothetical protein